MRRVVITAMMILLIVPFIALGRDGGNKQERQSKTEREVLKQLGNWVDALKQSDMTALHRIMADDFVLLESSGKLLNREQDLEAIKSGDLTFQSLTTDDVKVFVY